MVILTHNQCDKSACRMAYPSRLGTLSPAPHNIRAIAPKNLRFSRLRESNLAEQMKSEGCNKRILQGPPNARPAARLRYSAPAAIAHPNGAGSHRAAGSLLGVPQATRRLERVFCRRPAPHRRLRSRSVALTAGAPRSFLCAAHCAHLLGRVAQHLPRRLFWGSVGRWQVGSCHCARSARSETLSR